MTRELSDSSERGDKVSFRSKNSDHIKVARSGDHVISTVEKKKVVPTVNQTGSTPALETGPRAGASGEKSFIKGASGTELRPKYDSRAALKAEREAKLRFPISDQVGIFLSSAKLNDRQLVTTPEITASLRISIRDLGNVIDDRKGEERGLVNCLDIASIELPGDDLRPLEELVEIASSIYPGDTLCLDGLYSDARDPDGIRYENGGSAEQIRNWCVDKGWKKAEETNLVKSGTYFKALPSSKPRAGVVYLEYEDR